MICDMIIDIFSIGEIVVIDYSDLCVCGLLDLMWEMGEVLFDKDVFICEVIVWLGDNWLFLILKILEIGSYWYVMLKCFVGMLLVEGDIL